MVIVFALILIARCVAMEVITVDNGRVDIFFIRGLEAFERFENKLLSEQKPFTWSEVPRADGGCGRPLYVVVDDHVYDVTQFVDHHAGGGHHLKRVAGREAGDAMRAAGMPEYVFTHALQRFRIGRVIDGVTN